MTVQHTAGRVADIQLFSGAGDRHIAKAAILLKLLGLIHHLHAGEHALLKAGQQHHGELQSL